MSRVPGRIEFQVESSMEDDYFIAPPNVGGVPCAGRIDPDMKALIQDLIQSGKTRFRKEGDLVRSALHWFMQERMKKFHLGFLDDGMKLMQARTRKAQVKARAYDIQAYKNANLDAVSKLWAMGAKADAVEWIDAMLAEAVEIHKAFSSEIREWVKHEPRLTEIMAERARMTRLVHEDEEDRPVMSARPNSKPRVLKSRK